MSDQEPEKNNLINFIAVTVESMGDQMSEIRGQISEMRDQMVTKGDLDQMATKSDVDSLRDEVAYVGGQVESMRDQMATKSDIARLESKLIVETTAIRGDIEQVHLRLDSIERALRARLDQIETEMSRLRSVVYLLVKDRPEMLRLLGQSPPVSDEGRP
ncbi:MAG: hypothetical protein QOH63_1690 [Acidobacteriota bacterium]|jgi:hypothetical protein|nr:hypothetical protein [Acidobacteriota bacterium]